MKRSPLLRYGLAALAVVLVLGLKLLLDSLITDQSPFLLLAGAVMVSAWFGGLGPGLLATVLGAMAVDYFFLPPVGSFTGLGFRALPLVLFVLQGVLISSLAEALRSARQRALASALEARGHRENLRRSEERYRAVIEQAAEGICLIDADTKRVLEANSEFQRMFGYTPEEVAGLSIYDFIAHDREDVDRNFRLTLEKGSHTAGERRYRRKDGTLVDVMASGSAISYGGRKVTSLVIRNITERRQVEERLRRSLDSLLALYEAGQIMGSTLRRKEIGARLLEIMQRVSNLSAAVINLRDDQEQLPLWHAIGSEDLCSWVHRQPEAQAACRTAMETEEHQLFELQRPDSEAWRLIGLVVPLRVRNQITGVVEAYGSETLAEKETVEIIASLASQAASALENSRLYEELVARERQLQDLVSRLLVAQEEERRRVAYDVHDGLTQAAVAAYQHLQAFADDHSPNTARAQEELDETVDLIQLTVKEARRVIADLRPTALDDFGLAKAISLELDKLRSEDYEVVYEETLGGARLPVTLETALFRVAQEALTNVRKHAQATRVCVVLQHLQQNIRLEVRDWGRGFQPNGQTNRGDPGEKVGLSSMQERVTLLGGHFEIDSNPGVGTSIVAEVPLPVIEENADHEE